MGFFLLVILFLLLTIINIKIKTHKNNIPDAVLVFFKMSKEKKQTIIVALLTVFILIIFQIFFYFFGLKYLYIGTAGVEELYKFTLDNLREDKNNNSK